MSKEDYYRVLGVERDATKEDLKKAFRRKALDCHPDRHPGDKDAERRFKELNEAHDVLKDDQKRAAYDRFGHAAFEHGSGGFGAGGGGGGFRTPFSDIFDEMFSDFVRPDGRRSGGRGSDLRYDLQITLEEAFGGAKPSIRVPTAARCETCDGTGAAAGSSPETCTMCRGAGRVRAQQGFFTVERTCPSCGGAGQTIRDPCRSCGGAGRVQREKTLQVTIPSGVEDGTRIRLSGEGEAGTRGGPPGDLYIFISVGAHRLFRRDGPDIHCRVPLPMTTAALGGSVEVATVDGERARISIPAGTQTGETFRLRGKGMTILRHQSRGDMYVEAVVETPRNLTETQRRLLQEFASDANEESTSPDSHGFFAKVKELWQDLRE